MKVGDYCCLMDSILGNTFKGVFISMIETSLLRTIYTGLTRVFLYGIPMVTLVCGILLIVKKISKGKGVFLCILSVLFLIPVLPSNWEYFAWFGIYIVAGQIFTGIMLVGIGVKERKKNLESGDTRFDKFL